MNAKNHAVVLPDAAADHALNAIIGAAFGAAGQRCMALSVSVFVGEARELIPQLVQKAKALIVNQGSVANADLGPMVSPQALQRAHTLIQSGVDQGKPRPLALLTYRHRLAFRALVLCGVACRCSGRIQ
jgi:malonate-semialdehyde dehydrogenase (acetylating)/methylmalonate-semialdehyde dehydrogenase